MFITRSSEYAIELVLYLARHQTKNYSPLKNVAEKTGLSYHFLGKISQVLVKSGILKTYRGPNGGVTLAKTPGKITLFQVVSAIEGDEFLSQCMLKPEPCSTEKPCAIHSVWEKIREEIHDVFHNVTMEDIIRDPNTVAILSSA